jgi:hypothetical protein
MGTLAAGAAGWRELHHGQLVQQPADCFDAALLASCVLAAGAARLVGGVMGQHATAFVPDSYLFWRLAMLAEAGLVVLTPQRMARPTWPCADSPRCALPDGGRVESAAVVRPDLA